MVEMNDDNRTRMQLVEELQGLRQRVAELRGSESHRGRTGRDLLDSEIQHRAWLDSIADPVLIFDQETKLFLDCNQAAIDRYGYTLDELRAMTPFQLHPPDEGELERVERNIDAREDVGPHTYTHITRDGERLRVAAHTNEITYHGRDAWISVVRDITERERTAEALQESERRFRAIAETVHDAIIIFDSHENIFFWNEAAKEIFGYWAGETRGRLLASILSERSSKVLREEMERLVSTGKSGLTKKALEITGLRKDGSELFLDLTLSMWRTREEPFFTIIAHDITGHRQVEEALRESDERYRAVAESEVTGIGITDPEENFIFVNPAFAEMLGYTPDELIGMNLSMLATPEEFASYQDRTEQREEGVHGYYETVLLRKDGSALNILVSASPLTASNGSFQGTLAVIVDITERKQAEKALQEAHKELERHAGALERRTVQLEAAAEVARGAAAIHDVNQLFDETVHLISRQFGFYHAGIFLVDDAREYAVLRAASSEGGQRMLARGHKLRVGEVGRRPVGINDPMGIVGYTAGSGKPRIALDVDADAVFFNNPDLPLTRSEMALPLRMRDRIIGVLDVQSTAAKAFTDEDVAILQTMADQVALAIENARLLEASQRSLRELQVAYRDHVRTTWEGMESLPAFEYDRVGVAPASPELYPAAGEALNAGRLVTTIEPKGGRSTLAAPLRLRDQVIGAITLEEMDEARPWTEDEIQLVEEVSTQVALALESARLFEETQSALDETEAQAHRLALLNEMSDQLGRAANLDQVLDIAATMTGQIFVADRVSVALLTAEGDTFEIFALHGESGAAPTGTLMQAEGSEMEIAVRERRLIIERDSQRNELGDIRSFMVAPLYSGARPIGTLNVANRQSNVYDQRDGNLLLQIASLLSSAIENRRLFEETRIRAEELAVLNELAQTLAAQLDVEQVLDAAYGGASRLVDTTNFYIALYDPEKDEINFPLVEDSVQLDWSPIKGGEGLTGRVIEARKPLLLPKGVVGLQESGQKVSYDEIGKSALSWLGVPLTIGGQVLGVMTVQSYTTSGLYDERDQNLLMAIASQMAIALQNARLFEETRIRAEELAVLNELAQALTAQLNVEQVLDEAYRGASRLLDTTNFYIALYNPDEDEITFALDGTEGEVRKTYTTRRGGKGITEHIIHTRRSLLMEENVAERLEKLGIDLIGQTALSWLGVPLMIGDRVLGVIAVQSYTTPRLYDKHDKDLLAAIANQTAIALQNAYLFGETQAALTETRSLAEELTVLNELAQALTAQLNVDQVIEEAFRGASRLLDTANFAIGLYESEQDEIVFPFFTTESEIDRQITVISANQGLNGYIVRNRTSVLISENMREWHEERGIEAVGELARCWLGVPMTLGGQVLGVISVQSYTTPRLYDEHDRDLLRAIASQAAIALQNARLFEETQSRLAQLAALGETASAVASTLELDKLLNLITQQATTLLQGEGGIINLVDWENEEDEVVTAIGSQAAALGVRNSLQDALSGWVALHNEPAISNQLESDERADARFRSGEMPGHNAIIAPLTIKDQVVGTLVIMDKQGGEGEFDRADLDLLMAFANQAATAIENARLFEETRGRAERLALVNRVASAAVATLNLDDLMETVYEEIAPIFQPDAFFISLYDQEANEMDFRFHVDEGVRQPPERRPLSGFSTLVVTEEKPLMIRDLENEPEYHSMLSVMGSGKPSASWLGVPLMAGGQVLGVISVQSYRPRAYNEEDEMLLLTIADQIAVAMQNIRSFEEARNRAERLAVVNRITSATSATLNLDDLMETVYQELVSTFQPDGFFIALYDERTNELDFRIGIDEGVRGGREQRPLGGFSSIVIGERKPLLIRDYDREQDRLPTPMMVGAEAKLYPTWLGVPMLMGRQVIGVISVMSNRSYAYDEEDELLLFTIADQIAVAMQNIRLFEEARIRAEELAVLNELSQALTAQLDVEQVVEETYRGASRLLDTTSFYVALYDSETENVLFPLAVEDGQPVQWRSRQKGAGLTEYVMETRKPLLIHENVAERLEELGIEMIGTVALSWLGAPVLLGGQVLGMVAVQSHIAPRLYEERDRDLLTAIASQMAIALQNANLFEETQRRAAQLAAAAEVARDATAILDVEQLLGAVVRLISDRFGFYHAGVFLLDEWNEYAVLQAASSEGGRRMLDRGHRLKVGEVGMVGYVTATGEPRIALDVGADAVFFDNPDLPKTRSAMTLPLKVRDRVIGALDVQSTEEAAFSEEDVAVLQTMADQLATAIENANLFEGAQTEARRRALINEVLQAAAASLDPEELLHQAGEVVSQRLEVPSALFTWDPRREELSPVAVHAADASDVLLSEDFQQVTPEMNAVLFEVISGRRTRVLEMPSDVRGPLADVARQAQAQSVIYVPLISRDQVLGAIGLGKFGEHPLVDVEFAELVAGNLSVALENARLFQEAVRTSERLAEVDRLKTLFLANMSHELRTPLNSIIGFSRVVLKGIDGPLTEQQQEDLTAIHNSGQHLLGLINDMLDISRIEAGKIELSFEKIDLREIVSGVMSTAIALVKDKPVELQQSISDDLPLITADARRVRQILLNLVANAAKFTDAGFVHVGAEAEPDEVIISVADSGPGISAKDLEVIFEPFTQADASPSRKYGGTGLGLTISTSLVELHGGRIWVESEVGEGSTFYFALPIDGPPSLQEEQELPADEMPARSPEAVEEMGSKLILCVDDDEGVITLFRRYLYKQGYRVAGLTEATNVVEEAKRLQPHAITLDVMMPQKDGWQVIEELKADPETRDIPVIMCTIIGDKDHGMSLGAADYLVKPIMEQDLLTALDRLDREEGHHRVLVVDDQPEDRELLRRMIESQEGYEVFEVASGQEAISLVRQVRPHIIVLDLLMPEVDGFAVLEAVKADESTRSIPIIVVTAKDLTTEDRQMLNHRTEALIQKGVLEQEELLEDVIAALQRLDRAPLPKSNGDGH